MISYNHYRTAIHGRHLALEEFGEAYPIQFMPLVTGESILVFTETLKCFCGAFSPERVFLVNHQRELDSERILTAEEQKSRVRRIKERN